MYACPPAVKELKIDICLYPEAMCNEFILAQEPKSFFAFLNLCIENVENEVFQIFLGEEYL